MIALFIRLIIGHFVADVVWYFTGSGLLGATEFVLHFYTDHAKCDGRITFNQDQAIHFVCKAFYVAMIWWGGIQ